MTGTLAIKEASLYYGKHMVSEALTLEFSKPEIVSIIGPNGSGKSTLLKALGRLLKPVAGTVYLNGRDMQTMSSAETARQLSVLPQAAQAPGDMTVRDLARCGRLPYQTIFSQLGESDRRAIDMALESTGLVDMQKRSLSSLSGGECQRAWLAMALAQKPQILLLDEPTTYLDIHYQLELMELVNRLHRRFAITVIMVLHDLNHAARFSHRLIAIKKGQIMADGSVQQVFVKSTLEKLYDVKVTVMEMGSEGKHYLACFPYRSMETD